MWREDGVAEIYTYIADTRGYGEVAIHLGCDRSREVDCGALG
jgi:hypothetical protein